MGDRLRAYMHPEKTDPFVVSLRPHDAERHRVGGIRMFPGCFFHRLLTYQYTKKTGACLTSMSMHVCAFVLSSLYPK
jgi:hypothetical protein